MKLIGYITVLVVFATVNSQDNCPPGEVSVSCKSKCEPTCEKPSPSLLSSKCYVCEEGCVCQEDLIRETQTNRCIPTRLCYKNTTCEGVNEEFNWCGSWCPQTCQSPCREPVMCILSCAERCACKPGFILDEISSKCVEPSKCPSCKCLNNEIWIQCKPTCEKTCIFPKGGGSPQICVPNNLCRPGCVCPKGFIRNGSNGKCIPVSNCSS